jgi:hypothetical protein
VITLNEEHLRRILRDSVTYFHEDRLHDWLEKDAPNGRIVEQRPGVNAKVVSMARLGGLHPRYTWGHAASAEGTLFRPGRTSLHCVRPPQMEAVRWFRRPSSAVMSLQSG